MERVIQIIFVPGVTESQRDCPPPVGQFITLNGQPYRTSATAVIKARKVRQSSTALLIQYTVLAAGAAGAGGEAGGAR